MEIRTIQKGFEAFETKFEPFERDSKHSKGFEAFEWKFEPLERIRSIRMEIRTIRKGFEAFEWKFEPLGRDSKHSNPNSNHSKWIRIIRIQI